jgi:hypothetical protein
MGYLTEDSDWVTFYPKFNSSFFIEKAGYFDERPEIHTSVTQLLVLFSLPFLLSYSLWFLFLLPFILFGWGKLYIHLPIKTGIQDCVSAAYGFNYHDNTIWFYIGGGGNFEGGKKWITINMPWSYTWIRTSTLLENGTWFNETKNNRVNWDTLSQYGSYNWINKNKWKETHPYVDKYDNTTVNATISVQEREWRPLGLKFCSLFSKISKTISVEFDQEVGRKKGSWKGGTVGCGYDLLPNETPYECLKRMENERDF